VQQQLYTAASTTTDGWYANGGNINITAGTGMTITGTINTGRITFDTADHVWQEWTTVGHTTGTLTWQQPVWERWIDDEATIAEIQAQRDELQARREQQSRERLAEAQRRAEDRLVAHARALALLDELLTPEEQAYRAEHGKVEIEGSDGHLYWLEMHRETVHGNVVRVDEHGCSLGRACVAPRMYESFDDGGGALPTPDGWVGQYLGLKFDTAEFLSHANWSGVRACRERAAA